MSRLKEKILRSLTVRLLFPKQSTPGPISNSQCLDYEHMRCHSSSSSGTPPQQESDNYWQSDKPYYLTDVVQPNLYLPTILISSGISCALPLASLFESWGYYVRGWPECYMYKCIWPSHSECTAPIILHLISAVIDLHFFKQTRQAVCFSSLLS